MFYNMFLHKSTILQPLKGLIFTALAHLMDIIYYLRIQILDNHHVF